MEASEETLAQLMQLLLGLSYTLVNKFCESLRPNSSLRRDVA